MKEFLSGGREIQIKLPHIELAAIEYGDKKGEPVLALHGWLDNAMTFARLAPSLEGLHIIAFDFAGHGLSQHKPAGSIYQLWEAVFDTLAVANALGWQRFSLLGHSLGAIVATMVAAVRPEAVKQLLLIDGLVAYSTQPEDFPLQLQAACYGFAKSFNRQQVKVYDSLDIMIKKRQQGLVPISYEAACYLLERGVLVVNNGYVWRTDSRLMIASPVPLTEEAAWSYAEAVKCPICLVLASQGLWIDNKNFMRRLAKMACETVVLEGGHHLHLDAEGSAKQVADSFNRFLQKA